MMVVTNKVRTLKLTQLKITKELVLFGLKL